MKIAEIFQRCQNDDWDAHNLATAEWDEADREYNVYLDSIREQLPETVRLFLKSICLHDGIITSDSPSMDNNKPCFSFHVKDCISWITDKIPQGFKCELRYFYLLEQVPVTSSKFDGKWSDSKEWMYDTFKVVSPGIFQHEILLSDGACYSITFTEFDFYISG